MSVSQLFSIAFVLLCLSTGVQSRFQNELDPKFKAILAEIHDSVCVGSKFTNGECQDASGASISAILASAGPCDQQDASDKFVTLANGLTNQINKQRFIHLARLFRVHERNSVPNPCSVICEHPPVHNELLGLFQGQDPACKAFPVVPPQQQAAIAAKQDVVAANIADAGQNGPTSSSTVSLDASTSTVSLDSSGKVSVDSSTVSLDESTSTVSLESSSTATSICDSPTVSVNASTSTLNSSETASVDSSSTLPTPVIWRKKGNGKKKHGNKQKHGKKEHAEMKERGLKKKAIPTTAAATSINFKCQNGRDAKASDKTRQPGSQCKEGESICLSNGQFGQCVNGALVGTPCSAGLQCVILPLRAKPGTNPSCDTVADQQARIQEALSQC